MAQNVRQYHTLDRDPDAEDWDECPGCDGELHFKGEDPHVDEFDIYAYFECRNDCRVRDVVVRYQGDADGVENGSIVRTRGRRGT